MKKILALAAVAFLAVPAAAHAGGAINIGQAFGDAVQPYVDAIVQALIAALVSWVLFKIKQRTGVEIDQGHRDALVTALQNQAGSLIADGFVKIESGKITIPSGTLADAATEVLQTLPDAAKHFGLTPDYVAKRIVDAIPQIAAGAQLVAQQAIAKA